MDHVDADDGVRPVERPVGRRSIQQQRRQQIGQARIGPMRRDAAKHQGIAVARLPGDSGQRSRKMDGMFAAAAGDFQHGPLGRHYPAQDGQDRIAVAGGGRCVKSGGSSFGHARIV